MFRIVTDTSSNLPTAYLQAENITVIPFTFPILHGEEAVGVVDLVSKKAYDVSGKEIALPAEMDGFFLCAMQKNGEKLQ